jgi:HAMP domain-containing protein
MNVKTRPPRPRYDRTDLEELRSTVASGGWQMLRERLTQMVETERLNCETAAALDEMRAAQGAVRALRRVLELPSILEREIRAKER